MNKINERAGIRLPLPMLIAGAVFLVILLMVIGAPLLTKLDPDAINLMACNHGPGGEHLLGTDALGRDEWTRLLYGGRTSLLNAFLVVLLSFLVGVSLGMLSGYFGGLLDAVWMRICDFILAFPVLLLAFVLVVAMGRGGHIAVIASAIIYTPGLSKLARSLVLTEKTKGYVETCRSVSFSHSRIIFRHILPNCVPTLMAELTLDFSSAIITLTSLSFLGMGVKAPQSDWGCMLNDGMSSVFSNPVLVVAPAVTIILVAISLNLLSDGILSCLDPELRKDPSFRQYERRQRRREKKAAAADSRRQESV